MALVSLLPKLKNMVLESLLPKLRVRWFTDNQNMVQVGSHIIELQAEALTVFFIALEGQVQIEPECIPQTCNEREDWLSCIVSLSMVVLNSRD